MAEITLATAGLASPAADAADLPVFNTLWIGERLSSLHILCLLSAIRQGHHIRLFGYRHYPELPGEVEQADAGTILPESDIFVHRANGSLAAFSDIFRFELIAQGHGAWMDTDQFFLRPIRAKDGFLACWKDPAELYVYNSVLLFPPESPLADEVMRWTRQRDYVPPWAPWYTRARLRARELLGLPNHVSTHRWVSTGPLLLGYACDMHGWTGAISPRTRFCPLPYDEKERSFHADGDVESFFTDGTEGVHLWHQGFRGGADGRNGFDKREWIFEEGSFLWRMAQELDLPKSAAWRL